MKKIPTLFKREYKDHKVTGITNELTDPSLQVVLDGLAIPTLKEDGSCCAIFKGELYKRYDAKKGKKPPGPVKDRGSAGRDRVRDIYMV